MYRPVCVFNEKLLGCKVLWPQVIFSSTHQYFIGAQLVSVKKRINDRDQ